MKIKIIKIKWKNCNKNKILIKKVKKIKQLHGLNFLLIFIKIINKFYNNNNNNNNNKY